MSESENKFASAAAKTENWDQVMEENSEESSGLDLDTGKAAEEEANQARPSSSVVEHKSNEKNEYEAQEQIARIPKSRTTMDASKKTTITQVMTAADKSTKEQSSWNQHQGTWLGSNTNTNINNFSSTLQQSFNHHNSPQHSVQKAQ